MTSGPGYYSNEELVRRLRDLARSSAQGGRMRGGGVRELRTLASTLADRIYDDPERWGIADISPEFRDDAAADTLMRLLSGTADVPPRTQVTEWFGRAVEARFRQLWAIAEEAREKRRDQAPVEDEPLSDEERESAASVLEENSEMWRRFEAEFPHDAFMVRLRYVMNRRVEDIAVMLDAPSVEAVVARINRGRDRFRMLCEQNGLSRRETAAIMARMAEEQGS